MYINKNLPYGTLGPEGLSEYDIAAVYDKAAVYGKAAVYSKAAVYDIAEIL